MGRRSLALAILFFTSSMTTAAVRLWAQNSQPDLGIFEAHTDVGTVLHPGSVVYDSAKQSYTISGSGENMWFAADAFQFVWKKISGDVTLTADVGS